MESKKLTVGMAVYEDFDGVYFSAHAMRMYHGDDINIVVVDNNPDSEQGTTTKNFVEKWVKGKYIPYTEKKSTSIRNKVFENSDTEYTMCIDPHVLVMPGGIKALLDYYEKNPDTKDLIQGPLVYDDLKSYSTNFEPVWRAHMYGIWETQKDKYDAGVPFEIPMQGLGLFSCKTDNWRGFNNQFIGFGAEEGYIHEKFRMHGGKCICIPQLKWVHRFFRPGGVKYPLCLEDRVWNYFIGWYELTQDYDSQQMKDIYNHFKDELPEGRIDNILERVKNGESGWR